MTYKFIRFLPLISIFALLVKLLLVGQLLAQSDETSCTRLDGSIFTSDSNSQPVNQNIYDAKEDVYLQGGPDQQEAHLPDGTYYYRVTDPSGSHVLFQDGYRTVIVANNNFPSTQLYPYDDTPNEGGEYKVWLSVSTDFPNRCTKTDNFKVRNLNPTLTFTPTPTNTPTNTPTATPTIPEVEFTITPTPTATPTATLTPTPTSTPTPDPGDPASTPTPTQEPTPTPAPNPEPTATPTNAPSSDNNPGPTATPTSNPVVLGVVKSALPGVGGGEIDNSNPLVDSILDSYGQILGAVTSVDTGSTDTIGHLPSGNQLLDNTYLYIGDLNLTLPLYAGRQYGSELTVGDNEALLFDMSQGRQLIYGHNQSSVFGHLNRLQTNDTFVLIKGDQTITYQVDSIKYINSQKLALDEQTSPLTLVTCDKQYSSQRLVISASQI